MQEARPPLKLASGLRLTRLTAEAAEKRRSVEAKREEATLKIVGAM